MTPVIHGKVVIGIEDDPRIPGKGALVAELVHPQVRFTATVDIAATDGVAMANATVEAYNVPDAVMQRVSKRGILRIEGGYDSPGPGVMPLFDGHIDYALPFRQGADRVWRIFGNSLPRALDAPFDIGQIKTADNKPPTNMPVLALLDDLIRQGGYRFSYLGLTLDDVTGLAQFVYPNGFSSPQRNGIKLLHILTTALRDQSKRELYVYLNPLDRSEFILSDHLSGAAGPSFELDVRSNTVYSSGPVFATPLRSDPNAEDPGGRYLEYKVDLPLDGRFALGSKVSLKGGGDDEHNPDGVITSVGAISHRLGGSTWMTGLQGMYQHVPGVVS